MFCNKCGNQVREDSEFCSKCGTKVLEHNDTTHQAPAGFDTSAPQGYLQQNPPQGHQQQGYGQPKGYGSPPGGGDYRIFRSPATCILLYIVTFGIYYYYWSWITNKQINNLSGTKVVGSGILVLGWFFLPLMWFSWYKWDTAIKEIGPRYNIRYDTNFILWIILTIFLLVGSFIMMYQIQDALNRIYGSQ